MARVKKGYKKGSKKGSKGANVPKKTEGPKKTEEVTIVKPKVPYSTTHPVHGFQINFSSGIPEGAVAAATESFGDDNSKFSKWLNPCFSNDINIKSVNIDAVTMFGKNIGFLYINAQAFDAKNNQIPGIAFLRGDSVCCLLIIKEVSDGSENESSDASNSSAAGGGSLVQARYHMVVVEEIKLPVSRAICQTPAGMLDGSYNMKGKMIDEIKEETGITISNNYANYESLPSGEMPLNTLVQFDEFIPSQGGCDEKIKVFAYMCERTVDQMTAINKSVQGEKKEGENIIVHIKPLSWTIIDKMCDSKLLIAASKFERKFPGYIEL